jgi:uncharacterized membrane protein
MLDVLTQLFAAVCGQNPGHTWAPGGMLLPCCQRCTGLYLGAGVAALLHLWLRPKLSGRFLEIHGAFLLFMAPFGFHWVEQGPAMRTITGVLFSFAVVTYLRLPLGGRAGESEARPLPGGGRDTRGAGKMPAPRRLQSAVGCYFLILGATVVLLPLTASLGETVAGYVLIGLVAWGAVALFALVAANVSFALCVALRWLRRLTSRRVPA